MGIVRASHDSCNNAVVWADGRGNPHSDPIPPPGHRLPDTRSSPGAFTPATSYSSICLGVILRTAAALIPT